LKYGSAGELKFGSLSSDEDIIDCLKNRPIKGNYNGIFNNSNDWVRGAAADCGLFCP
jgi:hypothetical protein